MFGQVRNWVNEHPWAVTAFGGGVFAGVLFCLPLVPYTLPDSAANILGAALGAVFAVWGAAWIARSGERRKAADFRTAVATMLSPLFIATYCYRASLEAYVALEFPSEEDWRPAFDNAQRLRHQCDEAERELEGVRSVFNAHSGGALTAYIRLRNAVSLLRQHSAASPNARQQGPASPQAAIIGVKFRESELQSAIRMIR